MQRVGFSIALFSAFFAVYAQIPSIIAPNELEALEKSASSYLNKPINLKHAYYSTKVLDALNSTGYKCACKTILDLIPKAENELDLFYGVGASAACNCKPDLPEHSKLSLKTALKVNWSYSNFIPLPKNKSKQLTLGDEFKFTCWWCHGH